MEALLRRLILIHKYGKVGDVKTTLELPDNLFRQAKATAALRGKSLKDLITAALRAHLEGQAGEASRQHGWRSVFGRARSEEVHEIDRIVAEELERVDSDTWR
jgi:hypothetical protein